MAHKVITNLVNKGVFGGIFLGIVAVVTLIAGMLGLTLSSNINTLGTAIGNTDIITAVLWVVATLIFAFVAVWMTRHSKVFKVLGRKEEDKVEIPKKIGILTLLVLGALLSISLWVLNWFYASLGAGSADLNSLISAFNNGDIFGVIVIVFGIIIVGFIIFGVTAMGAKKIQSSLSKSDLTKKFPDKGSL